MTDDKKKNALPYGYVLDSGVYRYTVRSVLGMGGFGITYYGELKTRVGNINVDVPIAIKEFFPASLCERLDGTSTMSYSNPTKDQVERARKDFMGEARRLNSLANKHPNIVAVNEVFETNNTAYYVMEYLEGVSLDKYIKENGPMDEGRMLQVMRPIIDAVAFLHRHRVTHLDIKPANIMIVGGTVDTPERPVLIDFGLSKHYDAAGNATSTINSSGFSDGYAPKEQYRGITTFSPASDVYALGATMLYCLTGQRLPSSLDLKPGEVAGAIPAGVSPGLRRTLERALALDKEDRYLDAGALLAALPGAATSSTTPLNKESTKTTSASPRNKYDGSVDYGEYEADRKSRAKDDKKVSKPGYSKSERGLIIVTICVLLGVLLLLFSHKNNTEEANEVVAVVPGHVTPGNLDLIAKAPDGGYRYFTQEEWQGMSDSDKSAYEGLGVVVMDGSTEPFYVELHDSGRTMDWYEADRIYGDRLPTEVQCRVIGKNSNQLESTIKFFGGNCSASNDRPYWGRSYNDDDAWMIWMRTGGVEHLKKEVHFMYTNVDRRAYYSVRAVAPLPASR